MKPEQTVTKHKINWCDAVRLKAVPDASVDLVVTSPPYPMIAMWDAIFGKQKANINKAIKKGRGFEAFEAMHGLLDQVWKECYRVLKPGRFVCINIGDATRTIKDEFALYPNHARILSNLISLGFTPLPNIIWHKQTNAPNKFMGSGMLPAGAYVTLEHEYILVARKGGKRLFQKPEEKQYRRESAFFWEERNVWFSDIWYDIKGSRQALTDNTLRKRSAAFPFEIPYRLINMYSVKQDTVLDPFLGTGTTLWAAMASGRNSVGVEIDPHFRKTIFTNLETVVARANYRMEERMVQHHRFVDDRLNDGFQFKHINVNYGFPVMTTQEKRLKLEQITRVTIKTPDEVHVVYRSLDKRWQFNQELTFSAPANPTQRSLFSG